MYKIFIIFCVASYIILSTDSFSKVPIRRYITVRHANEPKWIADEDGVVTDNSLVSEILSNLTLTLSTTRPAGDNTVDEALNMKIVDDKFEKLIQDIRQDGTMSSPYKAKLITEASIALDEYKADIVGSKFISGAPKESLQIEVPKTNLYSAKDAPYILIYGPGPIGQSLLKFFRDLGKSIQFKAIDGDNLSVLGDSELKFTLKDARTIIIAADNIIPEKKGWFGLVEDPPEILNLKSIRKLLNCFYKLREEVRDEKNVKIVAIGKAVKPSRVAASFLLGDTTDLDTEILLQCQQRNFGYFIVKYSSLLLPGTKFESSTPTSATKRDEFERTFVESPVQLKASESSMSNGVVTKLEDLSAAVLRGVGHPWTTNCSMTVISANEATASDSDWDDQFLKIAGPELLRIPLKYASATQTTSRLSRLAVELRDRKGQGSLITPVEVTTFLNGVRMVFRPKESTYVSAKEERVAEADSDVTTVASNAKSKYVSPEKEALKELRLQGSGSRPVPSGPQKKSKAEGGLEVLVETLPYTRVRIRRCEMGPQTVVKVESEAAILKAMTQAVEILERDYKALLTRFSAG